MIGVVLAAAVAVTLPPQLHGQWTEQLADCGGEDTTGVTIAPGAIEWYEARGKPTAVRVSGRQVEATVSYSGEGRTWTERNRFTVAADGRSAAVSALGRSVTLARCPAAKAR